MAEIPTIDTSEMCQAFTEAHMHNTVFLVESINKKERQNIDAMGSTYVGPLMHPGMTAIWNAVATKFEFVPTFFYLGRSKRWGGEEYPVSVLRHLWMIRNILSAVSKESLSQFDLFVGELLLEGTQVDTIDNDTPQVRFDAPFT